MPVLSQRQWPKWLHHSAVKTVSIGCPTTLGSFQFILGHAAHAHIEVGKFAGRICFANRKWLRSKAVGLHEVAHLVSQSGHTKKFRMALSLLGGAIDQTSFETLDEFHNYALKYDSRAHQRHQRLGKVPRREWPKWLGRGKHLIKGVFVGGCIDGDTFADDVEAHSHLHRKNKGWICFRSHRHVNRTNCLHELAHIMSGEGHTMAFRLKLSALGGKIDEFCFGAKKHWAAYRRRRR